MPSREEVRTRDLWACARCGRGDTLQVHHRRMRSQGGRDTFSNLVTLCSDCHRWVHHNPRKAQEAGWLIPAGFLPAAVALSHHAWPAGPIWLADDGTVSLLEPRAADCGTS